MKVLKQRMAFCNFPLAAAERCERVNVDVYAPCNMRNVIDSMAEINTYFPRLCSIGLAEQTLNDMAPHLALSTSWTLLLFLLKKNFTGHQRLLTVQAPVSWCVITSVFHDLAEGMLNTRHSAIDRRLVVGSGFHMFHFTYMHVHDTCEGGGGGHTVKDSCADQDVCLMFKQFKKL